MTTVLLTLCGFSHFHKVETKGLVSNAMKIKNKITPRQLLTTALFFNLLHLVDWNFPCMDNWRVSFVNKSQFRSEYTGAWLLSLSHELHGVVLLRR